MVRMTLSKDQLDRQNTMTIFFEFHASINTVQRLVFVNTPREES